ncbi:MAG: hypothetical protein GEU74_16755, partial [Nitriliruptorales bacterium]|nr:hypothetical protein [Nitriliruptorales bacterium]
MRLEHYRSVLTAQGPCATVELAARTANAQARSQMSLRWRELIDRLSADGADRAILQSLQRVRDEPPAGVEESNGRVVVANRDGVVFDELTDVVEHDGARLASLPHIAPYLRRLAGSCRQVVVVADSAGADVHEYLLPGAQRGQPAPVDSAHVVGSSVLPLHKPRNGHLAHRRIQQRVDEAAHSNAADVIEHLRGVVARFQPSVVVLAGQVRARQEIRHQLPAELADLVTEARSGGTGPGESASALHDELVDIATSAAADHAEETAEEFGGRLERRLAVQGVAETASAAVLDAVDTLLFEQGVPVTAQLLIGPKPQQLGSRVDQLAALGAADPQPADAADALLRAC